MSTDQLHRRAALPRDLALFYCVVALSIVVLGGCANRVTSPARGAGASSAPMETDDAGNSPTIGESGLAMTYRQGVGGKRDQRMQAFFGEEGGEEYLLHSGLEPSSDIVAYYSVKGSERRASYLVDRHEVVARLEAPLPDPLAYRVAGQAGDPRLLVEGRPIIAGSGRSLRVAPSDLSQALLMGWMRVVGKGEVCSAEAVHYQIDRDAVYGVDGGVIDLWISADNITLGVESRESDGSLFSGLWCQSRQAGTPRPALYSELSTPVSRQHFRYQAFDRTNAASLLLDHLPEGIGNVLAASERSRLFIASEWSERLVRNEWRRSQSTRWLLVEQLAGSHEERTVALGPDNAPSLFARLWPQAVVATSVVEPVVSSTERSHPSVASISVPPYSGIAWRRDDLVWLIAGTWNAENRDWSIDALEQLATESSLVRASMAVGRDRGDSWPTLANSCNP